jgi:hypothetical protein
VETAMSKIWIGGAVLAAFVIGFWVSGNGGGFDFDDYRQIKQNDALSDAVHEWMHAYIEEYCRVEGRRITCE